MPNCSHDVLHPAPFATPCRKCSPYLPAPWQEALLDENASIVRKVASEIDQSLEQAQQRYLNATREVGGATDSTLSSSSFAPLLAGALTTFPIHNKRQ